MKFNRIALLVMLVFSSAVQAEEFSFMAPGSTPGLQNNNVWGIVPPSPTERVQAKAVGQVKISLPPAAPDTMSRPRLVEAAVNPRDGSLDFAAAIPVQTVVDYGIPGVIAPETLALDKISMKNSPVTPPMTQASQPLPPAAERQANLYQPGVIVPPVVIRQEPALQNSVSMQKQDDIFNFSAPHPSFSASPATHTAFQNEIPPIIPRVTSYPEHMEIASPEPVSLASLPIPVAKEDARQPAPTTRVPMEGITAADFFLSGAQPVSQPSAPIAPPAARQNPTGMQNNITASESISQFASNNVSAKSTPPSLPPELLSSLPSGAESPPVAVATAKLSNPEDMVISPSPEAVAAAARAVPPLLFPATQEEISAMAHPASMGPGKAAPTATVRLPMSLPRDTPIAKQDKAVESTFLPAPVEPAAQAPEEKAPMIKFKPAENAAQRGKSAKQEEPKFNMPKLSLKDSKGQSLPSEVERPAEQKAKSQTFLSSFTRKKDIPPPLTQTRAKETPSKERQTATPSQTYGEDAYNPKEPPLPPGMYF